MSRDDFEARLRELEQEQERTRRRLHELEELVQNAPGSHSPGAPSPETIRAEREIQSAVLRLADIDRKRQELTVAASLSRP
jgi:hypothetical protein